MGINQISLKNLILIMIVLLIAVNLTFYIIFGSFENFAQFKEKIQHNFEEIISLNKEFSKF